MFEDPKQQEAQDKADLALRTEQHNWKLEEIQKQQDHEKAMKELDTTKDIKLKQLETALAQAKGIQLERQVSRRLYAKAIAKIPAFPFVVFFIFILTLTRRPVPASLERFLEF